MNMLIQLIPVSATRLIRRQLRLFFLYFFVLTSLCAANQCFAQVPKLKEIQQSRLRDLDAHCPITAPESLNAWNSRASELKLQVRVALGIHPMPTLSQKPAVIHGFRKMDGYTIEKVYFESLDGFYVTGSLYRPLNNSSNADSKGNQKRSPLVLMPHGHWEEGRFYNAKPNEVNELLATGAERFTNAAINHMQAHCVQLARMGVIVFQYDMIGYADNQQISLDRAHRFGIKDQDVQSTDDGWPFFSPTAEGYLQSIMGLQTINTIQAINRIASLPDVDPAKIAITGASGGGTQSFIAMAVDNRLLGAFPAVMVSTGMQGGCTCENACYLRTGTGNVEIAALSAPRSLGLTSANDWTKTFADDGFPTLQSIYSLFGKKENVTHFAATHFPHNYNQVSRLAMYAWANKLFQLGLAEPIFERDFELLQKPDLTVWDASHKAPESGPSFERKLLKAWGAQIDKSFASDTPKDLVDGWRTLLQPAIPLSKSLIGAKQTRLDREETDFIVKNNDGIIVGRARLLGQPAATVTSPVERIVLRLEESNANASTDKPTNSTAIYQLTIRDPFSDDSTLDNEQALVANPRPSAAFTYGYNPPQLVRKLAVVLALSKEIRNSIDLPQQLTYDSENEFLAVASQLLGGRSIESIQHANTNEKTKFSFKSVESIRSPNFLPGALRYQNLEGLKKAISPIK
ncbi:MAG: hypothetical protein NTW52_09930 [Planctomycetota bacterium]|nr:hypothetical protein [Planctomycetota bacterium]